MKRLGKTDYKYVYIVSYDGVKTYSTEIPTFKFYKCFPDIRDTAVNKKLMENGKDPVNILYLMMVKNMQVINFWFVKVFMLILKDNFY